MSAQHTPGPWDVTASAGGYRRKPTFVVRSTKSGRRRVARVDSVTDAPTIAAAPELAELARRIECRPCEYDVLNPCWDNRPADVAGTHWGVGDSCPPCFARAIAARMRASCGACGELIRPALSTGTTCACAKVRP